MVKLKKLRACPERTVDVSGREFCPRVALEFVDVLGGYPSAVVQNKEASYRSLLVAFADRAPGEGGALFSV